MPVLTTKKAIVPGGFIRPAFGRMVYAWYSDMHGKWTAGFCMTPPAIMPASKCAASPSGVDALVNAGQDLFARNTGSGHRWSKSETRVKVDGNA